MSFLRHGEIYRCHGTTTEAGSGTVCSLPALIIDEFPAGYSLAGLLSSRARLRFASQYYCATPSTSPYHCFAANGEYPLNCVSHAWGSVH
jgi:hypothetical protein